MQVSFKKYTYAPMCVHIHTLTHTINHEIWNCYISVQKPQYEVILM